MNGHLGSSVERNLTGTGIDLYMEEAPICALVDAMFRLPAKLDRLLARHGHMLPRGAEDEIPLIKQDLERMISILEEHVDLGAEDRAMMVNCMTKEVRELSYDMEDSVDQYEHAANTSRWILSPRRKKYKITRRRGKTAWRLPEKLKWRLWMANKIREFSVRSQEALQRYSLLNHPGGNGISSIAASTSTRCDPSFSSWHPTPYGEPVGIDASLKKIEAWLDKDGEQKLKVVSVVGTGGVGKTTLANELYRRIGGQFECRAFVRTSRKPDVRRLLISMLSQVRPHQTPHTWKVHSLISDIRTHLQDKRYLIVIDDIWDVQTWDIINRALPDGNLCSGILITTEVEDVALKCCGYDSKYIFAMKPLGHDDSSKLFFNTAFGPNYECAPELSEVANNIIRKCGGLPLATVIVASLLVRLMGNTEQWDYVTKSLGYGLRTNPTVDGMKQVLNLRYDNLPHHLKACLMYLSIYKEDYIIQKDDLVKQWISEGLIRATDDKDNEEISRSYFDGLISSRMIQPVHINDNDDILSCAVHYMVLDLVREKSIEENFVTIIDHCQTTARVADKVRRLSLHFGNAEATLPTNMRLSQARTLAFFGVLKCLPSVVEFGLLQVLILHLWGDDDDDCISFDLTRISELFRLRYLHVKCNVALKVQKIQMQALQCLETLKIDARVSAVPSDIAHLSGLLHLSLPIETKFPNGIGNMTSLCTLGYFDLTVNSRENVQSLGELVNLRDLRLTCSAMSSCHLESKMESMGSILTRLSNLRSLTLEPSSIPDVGSSSMSISCDGLSIISSAPEFLRRFEWLPHICTFSSLPQWIRHLDKLCILKIGVTELVRNDVDVLRGLSALTVLSLYVRTNPVEKIVFDKTGFMVLKYFNFRCSIPRLEFQVDAMPNLRNLKLGFDAHEGNQHGTIPIGIEHLSGLKEISARIGGSGADDSDRMAVESALSDAFKFHPARPTFNIQCVDRMFTGKDDNIGGVQEKEHLTLQKQCAIMEEDSIEQHEVLQKASRKDAHNRFSALSESNAGADKQTDHRFFAFSKWRNCADKHADSSTRPQCRIDDMDELSSSRRWSTLLKKYAPKEEDRKLQTQYGIMEEDSNEEHGVLKKDFVEDAEKNVHSGFSALSESNAGADKQTDHRFSAFSKWRNCADKHADSSTHPQCRIDDMDELSSSRRWSTLLKKYAPKEEDRKLQTQYGIMEEDSNEEHGVLKKDFVQDAEKNVHSGFSALSESNAGADKQTDHRFSAFSKWINCADKHADSSTRPQCRIDDMDELSSSRRWSTLLKKYASKEEDRKLQTQYGIMEEDSNEEHGVLKKDFVEDAEKNVHSGKMLPKWSTQVRLSSLHDIKEPDDGFSWMKYGQKDILGSKYPRDYYRCKHRLTQGCQAVKQLQRTNGDPLLFDATYVGNHICTQVANSLQSSVSGEVKAERSAQGTEHTPKRTRLKLSTQIIRRLQVRVKSVDDALDDGFSWRKYGQKRAVDSKYPRAYYRCTHKNFKGCPATRQVQRSSIDPLLFDVVYKGEHTCTYNALHLVDSISAGSKEPPATSESQITYGENSGSRAGVQFMPLAMSSSQVTTEAASGSGSTAGVRLMSPRTSNSQITTEAASGSGSTTQFWSGALDEVDSIRDDDMPDPDDDEFIFIDTIAPFSAWEEI